MIVDLLVEFVEGIARLARLARGFGILIAVIDGIVFARFRTVHLAGIHLLLGGLAFLRRRGVRAGFFLRRLVVVLFAARLVLVGNLVLLVLLAIVVAVVFSHLHGREHFSDNAGKGLLVFDGPLERLERAAGLVFDEVAPQLDHLSRRFRRFAASQLFADHQRQRFLERRILAAGNAAVIGPLVLVLEHRGEIVTHSGHPPCADGLDTGLFDGVVNCAGIRPLRGHPGMDGIIMAGLAQRHGIAEPAGHREIVPRRPLRQIRQPRPFTGDPRPVGAEGNLEFVVAGNGAHATRQRPPERLGVNGATWLCSGIVTASGHCSTRQAVALRTMLAALSFNSTPNSPLIVLGHQRPLQLVALVEEGQAKRHGHIAEDFRVFRPGDHGARAHHRRQITIDERLNGS
jgi:hypothetical protein